MKIKCSDCGAVFTGRSEYDTELKFNNHKCSSEAKYKAMSMKELRQHIIDRLKVD